MPKEKIDVFLGLDFFLAQMKKKDAKNKKTQGPSRRKGK